MPRIRTIKPEFWDSPSTAKASPWARLLFIAMWNWADDYGRGTANLKELEGFAFPNDDRFTDRSGNTVQFRELVAEVAECFGVVMYEADGRRYYAIPTWEDHQRNERRAKQSKYPDPPASPQVNTTERNMHGISATEERKPQDPPHSSGPGTGEHRRLTPTRLLRSLSRYGRTLDRSAKPSPPTSKPSRASAPTLLRRGSATHAYSSTPTSTLSPKPLQQSTGQASTRSGDQTSSASASSAKSGGRCAPKHHSPHPGRKPSSASSPRWTP